MKRDTAMVHKAFLKPGTLASKKLTFISDMLHMPISGERYVSYGLTPTVCDICTFSVLF